jgi:hypothetical protein
VQVHRSWDCRGKSKENARFLARNIIDSSQTVSALNVAKIVNLIENYEETSAIAGGSSIAMYDKLLW